MIASLCGAASCNTPPPGKCRNEWEFVEARPACRMVKVVNQAPFQVPTFLRRNLMKRSALALLTAAAISLQAIPASAGDCSCPSGFKLPKLSLPKLCLPKLDLPKLCLPKLPKLDLGKCPTLCSTKPSCAAPAASCCNVKPACAAKGPSCAAPAACAPACAPKGPSCAAPAACAPACSPKGPSCAAPASAPCAPGCAAPAAPYEAAPAPKEDAPAPAPPAEAAAKSA